MAPEQARGDGNLLGPAVDIYALGAILYECLTGRPPSAGATQLDVLEAVRTQEPVPPRQLVPAVPRDLEVICLRCLEKDPARRYTSAGELAAELGRFRRGEPIHARPVSRWELAWRWYRRNRAVAVLVAAVFAALLLGTAVSSFFACLALRQARDAGTAAVRADAGTAGASAPERQAPSSAAGHKLHALARSLLAQGRPEEARPLLKEAADILSSPSCEEDLGLRIECLRLLGGIAFNKGNFGEAEWFWRSQLELYTSRNLPEAQKNPEIRQTLDWLSRATFFRGRADRAEATVLELVAFDRRLGGGPDLAPALHDLARGRAALANGDWPAAQADLERALAGVEWWSKKHATLPWFVFTRAKLVGWLAAARASSGDRERARAGLVRFEELCRQFPGNDTAVALNIEESRAYAVGAEILAHAGPDSYAAEDVARVERFRAKALERLRAAVKHGFRDRARLQRDPELASLRDDAAFRQLLAGLTP
jgi:hypothetical protein